jgi:hypothetical protein
VTAERRRVGVWRVPRLVDLGIHLGLDLGLDAVDRRVVDDAVFLQVRREPGQGIVVLGLLDLLAAAVRAVVVVGRVGEEPVRLGLDQRGPFIAA